MWCDPHSEEIIVPPAAKDPAPETPFIHDRRRPGRSATVNPHLIPLLRAPSKAEGDAGRPDLLAPVPGIGAGDVALLLLPLWTVSGIIFWLGWCCT